MPAEAWEVGTMIGGLRARCAVIVAHERAVLAAHDYGNGRKGLSIPLQRRHQQRLAGFELEGSFVAAESCGKTRSDDQCTCGHAVRLPR